MRRYFIWAAVLIICSLGRAPLRAGLYNTSEPYEGPRLTPKGVEALGYSQFRDVLTTELSIAGTLQESPRRKHYLQKSEELEKKARAGALTTEEKVNLSEYWIRLGKIEEAVQLLTPVAAQERGNFMVFANLGTAHQLAGRLDSARGYLEQVQDFWPRDWPGLAKEKLDWYREAEKYHLKLVRLRSREMLRQPAGKPKASESLDDLFGGEKGEVHFVGEGGRYEAGKLAAREAEKLPKDAVAIVQQLLLWIPGGAPGMEETRLYWLLGEIYNARGYTSMAAQVFDRCVWTHRFPSAELAEHRRIVNEAKTELEPIAINPPASKPGQQTPASLPESRPIDLRNVLLISSVAGLVVLGLVYLQVRELIRRRKST